VVFVINNGKGPDVHVQLDSVLSEATRFHDVIYLPEPHLITGLRSPPSDYVTVRPIVTLKGTPQ
jgi:hypothetical protein